MLSLASRLRLSTPLSRSRPLRQHQHPFGSVPTTSPALAYTANGPPREVVQLTQVPVHFDGSGNSQVLVQALCTPVNPADINQIEGVYPVKPPVPAVGGNEGVFRVVRAAANDHSLAVDDWVVPRRAGLGTWRGYAVHNVSDLLRVDRRLPVEAAASFTVNPPTAYRLLHDFASLNEGDVVLQNGGNSAVGECVVQIARHRGVRTISLVRDRPDFDQVAEHLSALGATMVVRDTGSAADVRNATAAMGLTKATAPKLALDMVGGASASSLLAALGSGGTLVTYGGMSRTPVAVKASQLIFLDVRVRGFWMTRWNRENGHSVEQERMHNELTDMMLSGALRVEAELVPFGEYARVLEAVVRNEKGTRKFMLDWTESE